MQSDTEQEPQTIKKQSYLIRWLRKLLFLILGAIGFFGVVVIAGGFYIAYNPVNITPLAKYWLPLPIIKGVNKDHPAGVLDFDKLVLSWPAGQQGLSAPLQLELQEGKILNNKAQIQGYVKYAKIELALSPLFHREIDPLSVHIIGAHLQLRRAKDQTIQLDLPDRAVALSKSHIKFNLYHLSKIIIKNSDVRLTDEIENRIILLQKLDMNILPFFVKNTLGVVGHASAQLDINGHHVNISAQSGADENIEIARQLLDNTGILKWHIQIDAFNPADFSGLSPSLQALKQINLPISIKADIGLKIGKDQPTIEPYDAQLAIDMGKGSINLKGQELFPSSVTANLRASFATDLEKPVHVFLDDMSIQLRAPTALGENKSGPFFQFKGSLFASSLTKSKEVKIDFTAASPELDFATAKDYWPASIAKGAHGWVTENITSGTARGFRIEVGLASNKGWEHLDLVHLGGEIQEADHGEIHWLRPVPPVQGVKASLKFVDTDRIYIQFKDGYQIVYPHNKPTNHPHKLSIPKGDMWITGLDNHHETGIIHLDIQGKVPDVIALLYEPRLRLLSRHPLPFKRPSGDIKANLKVELPLKKKVTIEEIAIQGHNEVRHAYLDNVAMDKDLKDASLTINVDTEHLELTGKGIFYVFPVSLKYTQQFSHQNDQSIIETAHAKLDITPDNLKKMDVDTAGDFLGNASLLVNYKKQHNSKATVNLNFDLLNSAIQLPIWRKEIGQPAKIVGEVALNHGKLMAINNVHAEGKDLSVSANVGVIQQVPQQLNITSFHIGRSVGQASLNVPMTKEAIHNPEKGDIRLSVKAETLDAVPFLNKYINQDKSKKTTTKSNDQNQDQYQLPIAATGRYSGPRGRKWLVNLQAQKVYYHKDQFLSSVTAYMEYNGVRLMRLSFGMRKPFLLTASLFPKDQFRYFHLEARDFGRALETLGISTELKGGQVVFKGRFNDAKASAPFEGDVHIKNITLKNAPLAMRRLSDASIYGLFKKRKNKEIILDTIKTNLFLNDGILSVKDGLVHNPELGATLQGNINLNRSILNLKGTIVPAYAINKLFGYIPGIGKWFSPEKGGGFVAIPFDIDGSFKKPKFDLYPSRILTPGILRNLF